VLVLLSFVIFPLVYSLYLSFTDFSLTQVGYRFIGLRNFLDIVRSTEAKKSAFNTMLILIGSVSIEVVVGISVALMLNRIGYSRSIFVTLIAIPSLVAPTAVGAIWKMLLQPNGLVNYILSALGASPIDWFGKPTFALFSIIIADIWQWTPFVALIFLAGLTSIDPTLYEAAKVDGADSMQQFWYVTLPNLRRTFAFAVLFRAIDVIRFMDTVWIITRGGPGIATQTAAVYIYVQGFRFFRIGFSSAAAWLLLIAVSILTGFLLRLIREKQ